MCRLAAYCGPVISLEAFIIAGEHSLYKQSWQSREMQIGTVNADGYGFAWYDQNNEPRRYRDERPIWNDPNLPDLAEVLSSQQWLGYVRSATPGQGPGIDNIQPFINEQVCFFHNGFIDDFNTKKTNFISHLDPATLADIKGNTDSEYLFALFKQTMSNDNTLLDSGVAFINQVNDMFRADRVLLSCVIGNGSELLAIRHAIGETPPSLYVSEEPAAAVTIASEPLDERTWKALPEAHLLYIDSDQACHLQAIT